jgi:hypothetical protein
MIAIVKHPEGVVDSDPVWLVDCPALPAQRIRSGKQHAHVLATNMTK